MLKTETVKDLNRNSTILCMGLLCVDIVSYVPKFIREDSDQRCTKQSWDRGGNASNNASVLAKLGASVEFFGVMAKDHLLSFFQNDMTSYGINHSHCPIKSNYQAPTSIVISSEETGSRTIIHNNGGLPEITLEDFKQNIHMENYSWIHMEGRNVDNVIEIVGYIQQFNQNFNKIPTEDQSQNRNHNDNDNDNFHQILMLMPNFKLKRLPVSIEVEKVKRNLEPLLKYADVAFVGKEFAESQGAKDYIEAAQIASKLCQPGTLVICPWGDKGASYCIAPNMENENEIQTNVIVKTVDAFPPPKILDSLGAGDTFDASVIFALVNGLDIDTSIRFGCKVAGGKLGTFGFKEIHRIGKDTEEFKQIQTLNF